jgi:oligosaccharide repeat unit polymerase
MGIHTIRNRTILNPFFWFTFVWAFVLLIYSLDVATIYPALSASLLAFFVIILFLSCLLGILYDRLFLRKRKTVILQKDKPSYGLMAICALAFLFEVVYCRMVPLLEVIKGNSAAYKDFSVKYISFLAVSLTIALDAISSVKFFYGGPQRKKNLWGIFTCYLILLLSYSRGVLILAILITAVVMISRFRVSFRGILIVLLLAVLGAFVFNVAGNLRQKAAWNDSAFIMAISGFNTKYSSLSNFSWFIVYVATPLGNLSYNYQNVAPISNTSGLLSQLFPDFLAKRVWPGFDSSLTLVQPGLTVSSMFAGGYKYGGLLGMSLSYGELVILIFLVTALTRKNTKYYLASLASLSVIAALTFFDNMVTYSGYSFFLIFLVLGRLFEGKDDFIYQVMIVKEYLIRRS